MKTKRFLPLGCAFLLGGALGFVAMKAPANRDGQEPPTDADAALVRSLLGEDLSERTFDFATIAVACSGKRVLPLDESPAHRRVTTAIETALRETIATMNRSDSPVRKLRRINEASKFSKTACSPASNTTARTSNGPSPAGDSWISRNSGSASRPSSRPPTRNSIEIRLFPCRIRSASFRLFNFGTLRLRIFSAFHEGTGI